MDAAWGLVILAIVVFIIVVWLGVACAKHKDRPYLRGFTQPGRFCPAEYRLSYTKIGGRDRVEGNVSAVISSDTRMAPELYIPPVGRNIDLFRRRARSEQGVEYPWFLVARVRAGQNYIDDTSSCPEVDIQPIGPGEPGEPGFPGELFAPQPALNIPGVATDQDTQTTWARAGAWDHYTKYRVIKNAVWSPWSTTFWPPETTFADPVFVVPANVDAVQKNVDFLIESELGLPRYLADIQEELQTQFRNVEFSQVADDNRLKFEGDAVTYNEMIAAVPEPMAMLGFITTREETDDLIADQELRLVPTAMEIEHFEASGAVPSTVWILVDRNM